MPCVVTRRLLIHPGPVTALATDVFLDEPRRELCRA